MKQSPGKEAIKFQLSAARALNRNVRRWEDAPSRDNVVAWYEQVPAAVGGQNSERRARAEAAAAPAIRLAR